ncbi:MAG TPA: FAD:protein FMN transferase [Gaiellaceae bacterium]
MSRSSFRSMGTDVVVGGAKPRELAEVEALFERWERTFSRFRTDSELNRVNASEQPFIGLTPLFAEALSAALAVAARTNGLVDPTLGVAIEAAGYDRDFASVADDPRPAGRPVTGAWRSVRLAGTLLFRLPGTKLDLNGVVKAMVADAALELLAGDGYVSAGGDVAARGDVIVGLPGGGALALRSGGIATSGTTRRRWRRAGRLQHHLLDPRTGLPSRSRWREVTVAASGCLEADVAAKAAFLLSGDGPDWLDERRLPGRFVAEDGIVANACWREAITPATAAA